MDAYEPNRSFNYDNIFLENPRQVQGGSYFAKMTMNPNKQLYTQFPKCLTKQGVVSTKKGKYCDLMYERENETELVEWIERLETKCYDLIDANKNDWFHNDLAREDIESMTSPICRLYKSGKNILIRVNIDTIKQSGKDKCVVYNEKDQLLDLDLDIITEERFIIPLVLIEGIKFTSKSFEVEIKLLQMMVLDPEIEPMKTLMIKKPTRTIAVVQSTTQVDTDEHLQADADVESDAHVEPDAEPDAEEAEAEILAPAQQAPAQQVPAQQVPAQQAPAQQSPVQHVLAPLYENKGAILEEINIDIDCLDDSVKLKKPNEVYHEIYKVARQKAKHMKQIALEAYLEAKQIKTEYMLLSDDDDEDDDIAFFNENDN